MSSAQDRLAVILAAYRAASDRRAADLQQATTAEQAQAILDNVEALDAAYIDAARSALDANGAAVEAAYDAAKAASEQVDAAYDSAQALPNRIRAVSESVAAVTDLVNKASGAA